jgi:hypothetical protein
MSTLIILGAVIVLIAVRPVQRVALFCAFSAFVLMFPDSTFPVFVSGRALHLALVPFAIFAVAFVAWALDGGRRSGFDARPYAIALGALFVVGAIALTAHRSNDLRDTSASEERFAVALRDTGPDLPSGGILYVQDPPRSIIALGPTWLRSLAHLYYPGADVRIMNPNATLGPNDRLFAYEP